MARRRIADPLISICCTSTAAIIWSMSSRWPLPQHVSTCACPGNTMAQSVRPHPAANLSDRLLAHLPLFRGADGLVATPGLDLPKHLVQVQLTVRERHQLVLACETQSEPVETQHKSFSSSSMPCKPKASRSARK